MPPSGSFATLIGTGAFDAHRAGVDAWNPTLPSA
jgi:hypothetical protein